MKCLTYTVKGDPRTKKNSMMIAGAGAKCPKCGKFAKQWIRQGKPMDDYAQQAAWQIRPRPVKPIDFPVAVRYLFYMKTRRVVDSLNLQAAMDDILVSTGVLADDNTRIVVHHDGTRVLYDPDNPRTEIYITRVPAQEAGQTKMKGV